MQKTTLVYVVKILPPFNEYRPAPTHTRCRGYGRVHQGAWGCSGLGPQGPSLTYLKCKRYKHCPPTGGTAAGGLRCGGRDGKRKEHGVLRRPCLTPRATLGGRSTPSSRQEPCAGSGPRAGEKWSGLSPSPRPGTGTASRPHTAPAVSKEQGQPANRHQHGTLVPMTFSVR